MSGNRGFALVIALVVTALVTALVVTFINEVYLETGTHHNAIAAQQGSLFADGGIAGALQLLTTTASSQTFSSLNDAWAKPLTFSEERGSLRITIEEENGKLNLNLITWPNGQFNDVYKGIALRLLTRLKLPSDLLDSLADWIDTDDTPHPGGAESAWYQGRKLQYRPRNKPLETFEELKRIKGFTPDIVEQLRQFTTIYGDQPGGIIAAPININTAPREILLALDEGMTTSLVDQIIAYRLATPFTTPAELAKVPGMQTIAAALQTRIATKGTVYRIRSEATVDDVTRTIEAVARIGGGTSTIIYWREY
jgi:general secretion pathway protein K